MASTFAWCAPLLLTLMALAGCAGGSSAPASASAEPSSVVIAGDSGGAGGSVDGTVVNDEQIPIRGALVGLLQLNVVASTDASGAFVFKQVPPGTYTVSTGSLGYTSASKQVQVLDAQTAHVVFTLQALAVKEGYHSGQHYDGFVACGVAFRAPAAGRPALEACGVLNGTGTTVDDLDKFIVNFQPSSGSSDDLMSFVFETTWTPSQSLSKGLSIIWENFRKSAGPGLDECPCPAAFITTSGTSPLHGEVQRDAIEKVLKAGSPYCKAKTPCRYRARAFPYADQLGTTAPADMAAYVNQRFTAWSTEFYFEPNPANFTTLGD